MNNKFTLFLPYSSAVQENIRQFSSHPLIEKIFVLNAAGYSLTIDGAEIITVDSLFSSAALSRVHKNTNTGYIMFITSTGKIAPGQFAPERFLYAAESTGAGLTYSDYYDVDENKLIPHPVIDYQLGSVRDNFNFGPLLILRKDALNIKQKHNYNFAGLYSTRLVLSKKNPVVRVPEYLYSVEKIEEGNSHFGYVDSKNRNIQVEMEKAFTRYLKSTGAFLKPHFKELPETEEIFPVEASVVIPVKNRAKTISGAIESVLKQKTDFNYNLIIVDNHSTDGTEDIINSYVEKDKRVVHLIPERRDLGIGGCWNEAILNESCGKYCVQLDSDDIYSGEDALQKIITLFREENCAMVIGSYRITDFDLNEIPPGVIDHREWTEKNGRNNALRINGLGAPRAYYTPVIREIKFPNVSYGEDYSVVLAISRFYKIGRIYEPVYICRRWEGNSDASLPVEKENENNFYKDTIRTLEILTRKKLNREKK